MKFFHKHKWKITGVHHLKRFTPTDHLWVIGNPKYCECPITKVLTVCDCGKAETFTLDGTWTLEQLQPQPTKAEADKTFFKNIGVKI